MADIQHIKFKKIHGKRRQIAEILHSNRKLGPANRMAGQNLHRKFINNRFWAVQMLLKMAVNVTIFSTFEVQYGK